MERPFAQRQVARGEISPQVPGFVCISITDGHVVMPDWELAYGSFICSGHGKFSDFGAWAVRAKDNGGRDDGAVGEGGDYAVAALVECYIREILTVLEKKQVNF